MNENEFKPVVKQFFQGIGLDVCEIDPSGHSKQPDFKAIGKGDEYLIELKIKDDDPQWIEEQDAKLSKGELATVAKRVVPRNKLFGIIKKGVKQMTEFDKRRECFRVLWLHSAGSNPSLHWELFFTTLYGSVTLVSLKKQGAITCYYFHESAFFTWRKHLDGAILSIMAPKGYTLQLCVNSLSPRVSEFRKSELVHALSAEICDPDKLADLYSTVMIADCDLDRRNSGQVVRFLQNKYMLDHLQVIPMAYFGATAAIPDSPRRI